MLLKKNIRHLSLENIKNFLAENNEKAFKAKQIYEWLWKKSVTDFDQMTNISKNLRQLLSDNFSLDTVKVNSVFKSADGTIKSSFLLKDGQIIEGVLIPSHNRMTACISTQVGCALGCKFCATGKIGFIRNLETEEIYDQVVLISKQAEEYYQKKLSNIVYMGMGEPMLNYDNVIKSIKIITSETGLAISPHRITISSAGITKMIKKFADENLKVNLAISLHSANDNIRSSIMPVNKKNPLNDLIEALKYYYSKTNNRLRIEYLLLKDVNDSLLDAKELLVFCKNFPVKINIIEYNPNDGSDFQKSDEKRLKTFTDLLKEKNLIVNIRRSRGKDIDAACGQLANKIM